MIIKWSRTGRFMSTSAPAVRGSAAGRAVGWWHHVEPAPKDPITSVTEAFLSDTSPHKINLGVGAYRDDEGKPVILDCIRKAQAQIAGSEFLEPISTAAGSKLVEESVKLAYGKDNEFVKEGRYAGVQTLSGTGACRLFAEFQRRFYPKSPIYLPEPTWSNHHNIWKDAHVSQNTFRYYNPGSKGLDFSALICDIKNSLEHSFFLFHPCAHNPTGVDPTEEQWKEISHLVKVKNHFSFFDMAYQGFATGDLNRDAKAIRIFLEDGNSVGCAQSFSKIMGLYGHRVGCLSVLCADEKQAAAIKSQLQWILRAMYSSPPVHGILLVSKVLNDPHLKAIWEEEVKVMANRIIKMRAALRGGLEHLNSHLSWNHITNQVGMFCLSGLSPEQVDELQKKFHIYMTLDGRISMAGVTTSNVDHLANAIHEVTRLM